MKAFVTLVVSLTLCLATHAQTNTQPIIIQEQGSFAVGGSVISNPGTFDPITRTPDGQTFHGDHGI